MSKVLDRDKINDGDVLGVEIGKDDTVWLTLSHKANGIQIALTKTELEWLLSEMS